MHRKLADSVLAVGVPVLAVVCCLGLPLLLAAGAGAALAVWVGGLVAGGSSSSRWSRSSPLAPAANRAPPRRRFVASAA